MFRIRPAVLAPLIIIPVVTLVVLLVDGTAFEADAPPAPSADPCPKSAAAAAPAQGNRRTTYSEDAKPYTGPGPHTVAVLFPLDKSLPRRWTAPESRPYTAQLVACEYVEETGLADVRCDYRGYGKVRLMRARATYLLLEARTSDLVTRFELEGKGGCPATLPHSPDDRPAQVREHLDPDDIIAELRPYVEGEAR